MTTYRLIGPSGMVHGSIDEILAVLAHEIEPAQFYWFDDREDLTGADVVVRLLALKNEAPAPHTYVESVVFGRSVGGNPGDYRITRIDPTQARKTIS